MEIFGYIMALNIGLLLGCMGGGGSILAVPVFTYLFSLDPILATSYSLFVVGVASLIGGIRKHQQHLVDWKIALQFGIPALAGVFLVRKFVMPALPNIWFSLGDFEITNRMGILGSFAVLMLFSAIAMIVERRDKAKSEHRSLKNKSIIILAEGIIVGGITGFVGAGGGFLIIPALVFLTQMDIKKAIGTSLIIIAIKSILGFLFSDGLNGTIDWSFLSLFSLITIVGIVGGVYISKFINGKSLKKGFGYFILVSSLYIILTEFI